MPKDQIFQHEPKKEKRKVEKSRTSCLPPFSSYINRPPYPLENSRPLIDTTQYKIIKKGEMLQKGDEYYHPASNTWIETCYYNSRAQIARIYRRKLH